MTNLQEVAGHQDYFLNRVKHMPTSKMLPHTRRGAKHPGRSLSDDDASDVSVSASLAVLSSDVDKDSGHESTECSRAILPVLGELLRALLCGRRFRSDNRDLGRIEFQHDPAVVGIPLEVGVVRIRIVEFARSNLRGTDRGSISPHFL